VKARGLASRRGDDYGEVRNISAGFLEGRMVVVVWTQTRHPPAHFKQTAQPPEAAPA
jgi:hypothetical protein